MKIRIPGWEETKEKPWLHYKRECFGVLKAIADASGLKRKLVEAERLVPLFYLEDSRIGVKEVKDEVLFFYLPLSEDTIWSKLYPSLKKCKAALGIQYRPLRKYLDESGRERLMFDLPTSVQFFEFLPKETRKSEDARRAIRELENHILTIYQECVVVDHFGNVKTLSREETIARTKRYLEDLLAKIETKPEEKKVEEIIHQQAKISEELVAPEAIQIPSNPVGEETKLYSQASKKARKSVRRPREKKVSETLTLTGLESGLQNFSKVSEALEEAKKLLGNLSFEKIKERVDEEDRITLESCEFAKKAEIYGFQSFCAMRSRKSREAYALRYLYLDKKIDGRTYFSSLDKLRSED